MPEEEPTLTTARETLWRMRLLASGPVLGHLRQLRSWSRLSREEVEALQRERLADLLRHAAREVPYYREVLHDVGAVRDGVADLERFRDIPPLDKATIRAQGDRLVADGTDPERVRVNTSGGSTGEPVRFVQDRDKHAWTLALKLLFDEWAGVRPGRPNVLLWGSLRDLEGGRAPWRTRLGRWLRNETALNALRLDDATLRAYVERIREVRPEKVMAYANSVFELCRFAEREGLELPSPKVVMTSAATLQPVMRETIERVFGAPVVDRYGSREVGDIACERPGEPGLVVSAPTHVVEILRPDGRPAAPGEVGEIAVTLLTNRAMPLLRYRIGDTAAWATERVPSPVAWPRLQALSGRITDHFVTRDGARVYGGYFTQRFYGLAWLERFQVVQEEIDRVEVRLVPVPGVRPPAEELERIRRQVREVMGASCRVGLELVSHIEPSSSGKFRYTISKVGAQDAPAEVRS